MARLKHPSHPGRGASVSRARPVMLTAPAEYHLMVGEVCRSRINGWVDDAQNPPDLEVVWAAHRDHLIAAATAFGFTPYAETGRAPTGDGFEAWRAAFLQQYGY